MRFRIAAILAAPLTLAAILAGAPPSAATTSSVSTLFAGLQIAPSNPTGYDRTLFNHWVDADADGCDTRREVLKAESIIPVTIVGTCTIVAGQWTSWHEGATWTDPGELDIDHMVPLAEAWASGANRWSPEQREAYANDLDLDIALEAVTASVNRSKGDRDPAGWLPPSSSMHCQVCDQLDHREVQVASHGRPGRARCS